MSFATSAAVGSGVREFGSVLAQATKLAAKIMSRHLRITRSALQAMKYLAVGLSSALISAVIACVLVVDSRADLSGWHVVNRDQEYSADFDISTFTEYLALEKGH